MPKYVPNDKLKQTLADKIEYEVKGVTYSIDAITQEMIENIRAHSEKQAGDENSETNLRELLGLIIGQETLEQIGPIDIRELMPLVNWLYQTVVEGFTGGQKNEGESTQESPPLSPDSSDTPIS